MEISVNIDGPSFTCSHLYSSVKNNQLYHTLFVDSNLISKTTMIFKFY